MKTERALVDTNVLVYAVDPASPFYRASYALLEQARHLDAGLCVAPRNLAEFYRVVTDPRKDTPTRTPEDALTAIDAFLRRPGLELLPVPTDLVTRWMALLRRHPVQGPRLFDVILVATMLANDVRRVYTLNARDFAPFDELDVLAPPSVTSTEPHQ